MYFLPSSAIFTEPCSFLLNPALTELSAVATDGGAPVDDDSPKGAVLALTAANSTPGECLSVARYRFLHHTAVSFVSSDIRFFLTRRESSPLTPGPTLMSALPMVYFLM